MVSRRDALRSVAAAASILGAGCSGVLPPPGPNEDPPEAVGSDWSPDGDAWPLPARGPANARHSSLPPGDEPTVAWRADADGPPRTDAEWAVAAAERGTVYAIVRFGAERGRVQALEAGDGRVRWEVPFDVRPEAAGLLDDTLYLVIGGRHVLALDASDGTERWRFDAYERLAESVPERYLPTSDPNDLDPVLMPTPDVLYAVTSYGFHGFNPATGTERWRVHVPLEDRWARPRGVAVTSESVWATYGFPYQDVAELADGSVRTGTSPWRTGNSWPVPLEERVCVTPGRLGSTAEITPVAAGFRNGLRRGKSTPAWAFPGIDGVRGPTQVTAPATDGERLFLNQVTPATDRFRATTLALDASDGGLAWTHGAAVEGAVSSEVAGEFVHGSPAVAGDAVLVGRVTVVTEDATNPSDGRLVALDAADGAERWRVPVGVVPREVAVAGDRIYVTGRRGGIVALGRSG